MREYGANTYKKMVTSLIAGWPNKVKHDFGFAETIRWISTKWSNPNTKHDECSTHIVLLKNGEVKQLNYGRGEKIASAYATCGNYHPVRIEFMYDQGKELETIDELRDFANRWWWYEEDYEEVYSYGEYDHDELVYYIYGSKDEETCPEYYLENPIGAIPKDEDLDEEYWETDTDHVYKLQDTPCPFEYEKEEDK